MMILSGVGDQVRRVRRLWVPVIVGVLVLIFLVALLTRDTGGQALREPSSTATEAVVDGTASATGLPGDPSGAGGAATPQPADPGGDGIGTVALAQLPPEAVRTLALIDAGGPFPYSRDGVVFRNSEGLLPRAPRGTYHEFTVPTPGVEGRGARRIVRARDGTLYYTDDHYASFRRILR